MEPGLRRGPAKREVISEKTIKLTGERGTVYVTRVAAGCMLVTTVGYDDGQAGAQYFAALDEEIARAGFAHVFIDSRAQTGVSPEARDACATWVQNHGVKIRSNHLLFRSKLLELAVAVVNLMTRGPTKAHSNVAAFERLIREVAPTFEGLPTFESRPQSPASAG